jgi:hypothetical protein
MRFDLPLPEECQLLPQKQVLRRQGAAGIGSQTDESTEIEQDDRCRPKAMPQSDEEKES